MEKTEELSKAGRNANIDYYAEIRRLLQEKQDEMESRFLDEVMFLTTPKETK